MGKILQRLKILTDNEGIAIGKLERIIGASKGVLSRAINNDTDIQAKWLEIIADNYPQYSAEWLLRGEGSMLKDNQPLTTVQPPSDIPSNDLIKPLLDRIEAQAIEIDHLKIEVENLKNTSKNT